MVLKTFLYGERSHFELSKYAVRTGPRVKHGEGVGKFVGNRLACSVCRGVTCNASTKMSEPLKGSDLRIQFSMTRKIMLVFHLVWNASKERFVCEAGQHQSRSL